MAMRFLRMNRSPRVKTRPQQQDDSHRGVQHQPVPDPASASPPSTRKTDEKNGR
jgi:hypothetical protein